MRVTWIPLAAVLILGAPGSAAPMDVLQPGSIVPGADEQSPGSQAVAASLVGTWKSEPHQMRVTSDLERSVWGADASSVRTAELTIQTSGEATLTVTRGVLDGGGQMISSSTSVERAQLVVGAPQKTTAGRTEHAVKVVSAERLYPDDPDYRWPMEGLLVRIIEFDDGETIEIRFEPREGRGSFWEKLRRGAGSSSRAAR